MMTGYTSQSLSGFGRCFYLVDVSHYRGVKMGLNPFQGLVGVSTETGESEEEKANESQSLPGFGRCFYVSLR